MIFDGLPTRLGEFAPATVPGAWGGHNPHRLGWSAHAPPGIPYCEGKTGARFCTILREQFVDAADVTILKSAAELVKVVKVEN